MESYAMRVEVPSGSSDKKADGTFSVIHVMVNGNNKIEAITRVITEIHPLAVITRVDGPYTGKKRGSV